jgi:hypothetical protein
VRVSASHTPGCVVAVTLRVPKALAAFALKPPFWSSVSLHLNSQAAEIGDRTHFRRVRASRHQQNIVRCQGTVLLGVLVPTLPSTGVALRPAHLCARLPDPLQYELGIYASLSLSTTDERIGPPGGKRE